MVKETYLTSLSISLSLPFILSHLALIRLQPSVDQQQLHVLPLPFTPI